jgi:Flp pilus assembly protein TadD
VVLVLAVGAMGCAAVQGERHYRSGTRALERGDAASAVVELEAAAARAPGSSEVHNRLGMAYAASGRSDEAIREFENAVALDCGNQAALRNLERARGEREAER